MPAHSDMIGLTKEPKSFVAGEKDFWISSQPSLWWENVATAQLCWNLYSYKWRASQTVHTESNLDLFLPWDVVKAWNGFHRQVVTHSHNELLSHRYSHIKGARSSAGAAENLEWEAYAAASFYNGVNKCQCLVLNVRRIHMQLKVGAPGYSPPFHLPLIYTSPRKASALPWCL